MDDYTSSSDNAAVKRAMRNLMNDVKVLASDTRELLSQSAGPASERLARLRDRTRESLTAVEERIGPYQQKLAEQGRYAYRVSADHMRAHRWSTLAAAAAIALAVAAVVAWQNENETYPEDHPEP